MSGHSSLINKKVYLEAIAHLLPSAEHIFYLKHLYNNFKMKHKGLALEKLFWRDASATAHDFKQAMNEVDNDAYIWLTNRPLANWAKSHFRTIVKCNIQLNNFCESFNSIILEPCHKPIIMMLEIIRVKLMKRIHI
ncbi:unnamed protein product [Musa acuminata var. zebrina]